MRPASRPLRGPSGSSSARSASRWSVSPLSGSSRSQPSSKRSSAHAELALDRAPARDEAGERAQLLLLRGRRSIAPPSPRPPPGIGSARHAARSPRIHASGESAMPGRVEPQRRLQVAQLVERLLERARARAGTIATTVAGPLRSRHSGIGRQHLEALERHEQRALGELDLRRLAADARAAARARRARCARSPSASVELAVGGLEALGRELEVPLRAVEDAAGEAAQRVLRGGRAGAALLRVGVEVLARGRRARRARRARRRRCRQPRQRLPVALDEVAGQRLRSSRDRGGVARAPSSTTSKGISSPAATVAASVAAASAANACSDAWSLARLHAARFVRAPADPARAARPCSVARRYAATAGALDRAREISSQSQRRP